MSFTLTGTGGLFTRWGAIGKRALNIWAQIGSGFATQVNTVAAQYQSAQQDVIDGLYPALTQYQQTPAFVGTCQTLIQNTLTAMGRDDASPTNPADVTTNLDRLIAQMLGSADTISKPTVGAAVAAGGSNKGTGFLMGTTAQGAMVSPTDGKAWDYSFAETLTLTCTDDSYAGGGATKWQEPWAVVGFPAADQLNQAWPAGSGTSVAAATMNPDSATMNLAANGNFNAFTVANTPDSWAVVVGTIGTTVKRGTSPLRSTNSNSLQIVGDGAQLTDFQQALALQPETTYALNLWLKSSGGVAAGVIRVRLMDGSSTINDQAGTANAVSVNASALTTSYAATSVFFRTPKILPPTVKIEVGLTTALTNLATVDVTDLFLTAADQAYVGGPYFKVVPGATAFAAADTLTLTTTNNATTSKFNRLLDRFLGLRTSGRRIPSVGGGAETIPDSLIA